MPEKPRFQCRGLGLIPGQGTRPHRLQLRVCVLQLKISQSRCSAAKKKKTGKWRGDGESLNNESGVSTESDEKVLELDNSDSCIQHCEYTSCTKICLWVFYHNEK